jgi:hypothetical protein
VKIRVEAKLPRNFNPLAFYAEFEEEAARIAKEFARTLDPVTATWDTSKYPRPRFKPESVVTTNLTAAQATSTNKIVRFLNDGTRVRHAVLQDGYALRTRVRLLTSFIGQGKKRFVSKKVRYPGVKARAWDDEARKLHVRRKTVEKGFGNAIVRAIKQCGHEYDR